MFLWPKHEFLFYIYSNVRNVFANFKQHTYEHTYVWAYSFPVVLELRLCNLQTFNNQIFYILW
jgi:hypothetical protein